MWTKPFVQVKNLAQMRMFQATHFFPQRGIKLLRQISQRFLSLSKKQRATPTFPPSKIKNRFGKLRKITTPFCFLRPS